MTFFESALTILGTAGRPLHIEELTRMVLEANLLSHVGKTPQEVMESRLLAMARKPKDRKVTVTAPHTFALASWNLPEDAEALDLPVIDTYERNTGPLLRGRERDPDASPSKVRFAGRGERTRGQWREENVERRQHLERLKNVVEAVQEILKEVKRELQPVELAAAARDRELVSDDLGADALTAAIREDNRRRSDSGKTVLFDILPTGEIALHSTAPAETARSDRNISETMMSAQQLAAASADLRRAAVRMLLRRIGDLEGQSFDRIMQALLERNGFTDLKVARRNKDGAVFIARKKLGLLELRYAIRVIRGTGEVALQDVVEHGHSLSQYGSQMGIILSAASAGREVIQSAGSSIPPVFLFCGEELARLCIDSGVGISKSVVEIFELDEDFFKKNGDASKEDRERRRNLQNQNQQGKNAAQKPAAQGQTDSSAQPSETSAEAQAASNGNPAGTGSEQKRLSKRERYRQRREAQEAARRMAAASKAKAAAEARARAAQSPSADSGEKANVPQSQEKTPEPSAAMPATLEQQAMTPAAPAPSDPQPAVSDKQSNSELGENKENSESAPQAAVGHVKPTEVEKTLAEKTPAESQPKAQKSVYDPGKFGNFSVEALETLQLGAGSFDSSRSAEAVSPTPQLTSVPDAAAANFAGESAAAEEANDGSPERENGGDKSEVRSGRNRARHSRRRQAEKAAEMKVSSSSGKAEELSSAELSPDDSHKKSAAAEAETAGGRDAAAAAAEKTAATDAVRAAPAPAAETAPKTAKEGKKQHHGSAAAKAGAAAETGTGAETSSNGNSVSRNSSAPAAASSKSAAGILKPSKKDAAADASSEKKAAEVQNGQNSGE